MARSKCTWASRSWVLLRESVSVYAKHPNPTHISTETSGADFFWTFFSEEASSGANLSPTHPTAPKKVFAILPSTCLMHLVPPVFLLQTLAVLNLNFAARCLLEFLPGTFLWQVSVLILFLAFQASCFSHVFRKFFAPKCSRRRLSGSLFRRSVLPSSSFFIRLFFSHFSASFRMSPPTRHSDSVSDFTQARQTSHPFKV